MSSITTKIGLYKANPITEPNDNFNIDTLLNNNWDKIDAAVGNKAELPVANSKDTLITSTNTQTIASYTPIVSGNFEIKAYLRVLSAVNVTILVNYTDVTGVQTKAILPENLGLSFPTSTGIQAYKIGSYVLKSLFINAKAGSQITLTATASVANKAYISSSIVGV